MFANIKNIIKKYPLFKHNDNILEHHLSQVFLLTGIILSFLGAISGFIFKIPFILNIPNIMIVLITFFLPIIFKTRWYYYTVYILYLIGYLYFPFLYIANGGNSGAIPFYFIMIVIYFAFYLKGKQLFINVFSLLLFYVLFMLYFYYYPDLIVPYDDEFTRLIDILISFISIAVVMTLISNITFNGYKEEKNKALTLATELYQQNQILENLSIKDQLTNIYNRRYFLEVLNQELLDSKDTKSTFYVLMIDLDYFKNINDTYGHLYGDNVLLEVAQTIKSSIRSHDIVARYGGEEFAVILTRSTNEKGIDVAKRINKNVALLLFRDNQKITVSIGVSKNKKNDTVKDIIKRADDLLYKAKDNGRNKVEF